MSTARDTLAAALEVVRLRLADICHELQALPPHAGCKPLSDNACVVAFSVINADGCGWGAELRNFPLQYRQLSDIVIQACSSPGKTATALETVLAGKPLYSASGKRTFHPRAVDQARPLLEEALTIARELAPKEEPCFTN